MTRFKWLGLAAVSYLNATLTVVTGLAIAKLFGLDARGNFALSMGALAVALSIPNYTALERAARSRSHIISIKWISVQSILVWIGTASYLLVTQQVALSLLTHSSILTWAATSIYMSGVLGVLKANGDAWRIGVIRLALSVVVLSLLMMVSRLYQTGSTVLACYAIANISIAFATYYCTIQAASQAGVSPPPVAQLALSGFATSFTTSLDVLIAPLLVTNSELGVYVLLKSLLNAGAPILSIATTKVYGAVSNGGQVQSTILSTLALNALLIGMAGSVVFIARSPLQSYFGISSPIQFVSLSLIGLGTLASSASQMFEEVMKAQGKFRCVFWSSVVGGLVALVFAVMAKGPNALSAVCLVLFSAKILYIFIAQLTMRK